MNIRQLFIQNNRSKKPLQPKGIVIHSTDNPGASAFNHYRFFNGAYRGASAHWFVDWKEAIQLIPENEQAWHAGKTANKNYIGIELCEAKTKEDFEKVWNNSLELTASRMKDYHFGIEDVFFHYEISRKYPNETNHQDPIEYFKRFGRTPEQWKQALKERFTPKTNKPALNLPNGILKRGNRGTNVKLLQSALNQLGFSCGVVDGIFGAKTEAALKAFQKANGLVVDGIYGPKTKAKMQEKWRG